jgi:putative transcriptional regulator
VNDKDFKKLVASVKQAGQIRTGKLKPGRVSEFKAADIKAIRERLELSQAEFATMIGVSVATLQNWEQGRRQPDGPARALLRVAERDPEAVARALGEPQTPVAHRQVRRKARAA